MAEIQVLRLGVPHDRANHEDRVQRATSSLKTSAGRKVFVAGPESDGLVPVTIARYLDHQRIAVTDIAVVAKCWSPTRFAQEMGAEAA